MLLAGDELENTYDFEYTTLDMAWRYPKNPMVFLAFLNSKLMLVFILYYRYSVQVCWDNFTYNE